MAKLKLTPLQNACLAVTLAAFVLSMYCLWQLDRVSFPPTRAYLDAILYGLCAACMCTVALSGGFEDLRHKTIVKALVVAGAAAMLLPATRIMVRDSGGGSQLERVMFSDQRSTATLKTAADRGDAAAQLDLALLYAGGYDDAPADLMESARLLDRARLALDDRAAAEGPAEVYSGTRGLIETVNHARNLVDARMSPEQRAVVDDEAQKACSAHYHRDCAHRLPPPG